MQQYPQATFSGQVRRGSEHWKNGRVEFYIDIANGFWTVRLFHAVCPQRQVHNVKSLLGPQAKISFKCGRLIIGDKSDGELHIRVTSKDTANAQKLVRKICSMAVSTPNCNRAEVGLTSTPNGQSGSETPIKKSNGVASPFSFSGSNGWLSKKGQMLSDKSSTPPERATQTSAKRKIRLDPGDDCESISHGSNHNNKRDVYDLSHDDDEVSFPHFTGMKDYSKNRTSNVNGNMAKGVGATSFYGTQSSILADNTYKGLGWKSSNATYAIGNKSPKGKKPKLCDLDGLDRENKVFVTDKSKSLLKGALTNRMLGKGEGPRLSDPHEADGAYGGMIEHDVGNISEGHTIGFDNLGNTCFMNSPLQCLSSLEPLSLDIQSAVSRFGQLMAPNSITRMLYLLMKDVRKLDVRQERVREILTKLRHDINGKFKLDTQQDAHELLAELLDRTDEEVKSLIQKSENQSEMEGATTSSSPSTSVDRKCKPEELSGNRDCATGTATEKSTPTEANFTWFYKTSFYFHDCKTEVISSQDERDTTLMLALDSRMNMSLQDCIDKYFESTDVEMRCEKCGKEEKATMTRKIVKRPRCFILNLLRYQSHNLEAKKKMDRVSIPRYMSIVEFCAEDVKAAPLIEPIFMLDREETLPHLDNVSWDFSTYDDEHSFDLQPVIPDLPAVIPPPELVAASLPEVKVIQKNPFGAIGESRQRIKSSTSTHLEGDYRESCLSNVRIKKQERSAPESKLSASLSFLGGSISIDQIKVQPISSIKSNIEEEERGTSPRKKPSGSREGRDVQVVPGCQFELDPPYSCSSPKPGASSLSRVAMPLTPITDDEQTEERHKTQHETYFPPPDAFEETSRKHFSPLKVDVENSVKVIGRRRNPAGDRLRHEIEAGCIPSETVEVCCDSQTPGLVPSIPSPALPSESARTDADTNPAIVAARRGHAAVIDKMVGRQQTPKHGTPDHNTDKGSATSHDSQPIQMNKELDKEENEREKLVRVAEYLCDQFEEVGQHVDMARNAQEDYSELYNLAGSIVGERRRLVTHGKRMGSPNGVDDGSCDISTELDESGLADETIQEERLIVTCLHLLKEATQSEIDKGENLDFYRLLRKVISYRYKTLHKKIDQLNYLMEDIGLFLAARELGLVQPDSPKRRKVEAKDGTSKYVPGQDFDNASMRNHGERRGRKMEADNREEGEILRDDSMEECSADHGSLEVNPSGDDGEEGWSSQQPRDQNEEFVDNRELGRLRNGDNESSKMERRRKLAVADDKLEGTRDEEASSGAMADVSNNATINTTSNDNTSVFMDMIGTGNDFTDDDDPNDPILLGQRLSLYSEQELKNINIDSLSEDQIMVYVTGLSRFEYEREQIQHTRLSVTSSSDRQPDKDPYNFSDGDDFYDEDLIHAMAGGEDFVPVAVESSVSKSVKFNENESDSRDERFEKSIPSFSTESAMSVSLLSDSYDVDKAEMDDLANASNDEINLSKCRCKSVPLHEVDCHLSVCDRKRRQLPKVPQLMCEERLSDNDEVDGGGGRDTKKGDQRQLANHITKNRDFKTGCQCETLSTSSSLVGLIRKSCDNCIANPNRLAVLSPAKNINNKKFDQCQKTPTSPQLYDKKTLESGSSPTSSNSPSSPSAGKMKRKDTSDPSSRSLLSHSPSPSSRKDIPSSISVAKSSKTAKSDLARLRSPTAGSPRKKSVKQTPGKAAVGSALKRLSFDEETNSNTNNKCTMLSDENDMVGNALNSMSSLNAYDLHQVDLVNGSVGDDPDPDGIHKLLSPLPSDKKFHLSLISPSKYRNSGHCGEDTIDPFCKSPLNNAESFPVPVSSLFSVDTKKVGKLDVPPLQTQNQPIVSTLSTSRDVVETKSGVLTNLQGPVAIKEENIPSSLAFDCKENVKREGVNGANSNDLDLAGARSKYSGASQVDVIDKENVVEWSAREERLQNIEKGKADSSYKLVGIVNHHGESLFSGHYTAFSFNFNKQKWFFMDDKHTRGTTEGTARDDSAHSGYVFFYMDKDLFDQYAHKMEDRTTKTTKC